MANPWFRMYAEFASDPKVQMLSEANQRRLLMLFCLRCNDHVTLQDEEVTFLLRISYEDWMLTKSIFVDRGFTDINNEVLNWDKRQYSSDTSKNRVAAYRDRKKKESNVTVTLQKRNSNAIDTEQIQNRTDTESDTDTEKPLTPLATLMALGVSKKSAQDWLRIRKDKKLSFTDDALELFLSEIKKSGLGIVEAIKFCNGKSWGSFKSSWYEKEIAAPTASGGFKTKFQHVKENNDKAFSEFLGGATEKTIDGEFSYD